MSYHSLEDRLVKNFFKEGSFGEKQIDEIYGTKIRVELIAVNKKPITPGDEEIKINPRARSAKLRIAERKID